MDLDGDKDMALAFNLCGLVTNGALNASTSELVIKGLTLDGASIRGSDSVKTVVDDDHLVKPVFDYPVDGQTLDFEGWYLFRVQPIPSAQGYLWRFFQNGSLVWENLQDEGSLSGNVYYIAADGVAHTKFLPGDVKVSVRALVNGRWTDATIITIHLQPSIS